MASPLTQPQPPTPSPSPSFSYETSPHLYLFTSLTSGSSHIITATSRLETILKAHRVAFKAIDCATDERARRIWTRRAGPRRLPGLVREGDVLADLDAVEEWNEAGELRARLAASASASASARGGEAPSRERENDVPSFFAKGAAHRQRQDASRSTSASAPAADAGEPSSRAKKTTFKGAAPDKSGEGAAGAAEEASKSVGD